jgi:hypothetical protein
MIKKKDTKKQKCCSSDSDSDSECGIGLGGIGKVVTTLGETTKDATNDKKA